MFDKTHLFEAQTQGYRTYRIPAILCTKSGVLIATAEARRGKGGDWDSNDVVVRRSDDGGGNLATDGRHREVRGLWSRADQQLRDDH